MEVSRGEDILVVMNRAATVTQVDAVLERVRALGVAPCIVPSPGQTVISAADQPITACDHLSKMPGVAEVLRVPPAYRLVSRESHPNSSVFRVAGTTIGGGGFTLISGPCSVENEEMLLQTANFLVARGVRLMRGGAFKPRTSPYSFQGLGLDGLEILARVKRQTGIGVVTEVLDAETVPQIEAVADVLQVGARSMQNYSLLRRLARSNKPILLKRGLAATLEEWLMAAEYLLSGGNQQVILCERGVRTFADHLRNTLDLAIVPVVQRLSHLPILVDPSHGTGDARCVPAMTLAALAAGADGVMIELHPDPARALSDGPQSLDFEGYARLHKQLNAMAGALGIELR